MVDTCTAINIGAVAYVILVLAWIVAFAYGNKEAALILQLLTYIFMPFMMAWIIGPRIEMTCDDALLASTFAVAFIFSFMIMFIPYSRGGG